MDAVAKLSYSVSHHALHLLRINVHFSTIEKNIQSMKIDPSIIYMVQDHKQKVLKMR